MLCLICNYLELFIPRKKLLQNLIDIKEVMYNNILKKI